jgi:hypothetical protein
MTVIAYRAGIIAADSRTTSDNGTVTQCEKLYRKKVGKREIIIGTAGNDYLGMVFVDWYKGVQTDFAQPPEILRDAHLDEDFEVVILERGHVYTANHLCRPIKVITPFHAIGCGALGAWTAMAGGASARRAVELTCMYDPYCAPPVVTMRMPK